MRKRRVSLLLEPEIADLLDRLAAGPHKKSELVSHLLRLAQREADLAAVDDPLARLDQRVANVERQMALLLARLD